MRSIHIHPAGLADMHKEDVGKTYQPSNGTEGEIFFDNWCRQCARDKAMNGGANFDDCDDNEKCDLIARSFAYKPADPEYPKEWQYDRHGQPCCTAFIEVGKPIPEPRCERTPDMFQQNL